MVWNARWHWASAGLLGQLTAKNKGCLAPNTLFVCLLFVCLLVYLFICLHWAANSCPEGTKVQAINEKTVHWGPGMSSGRRPEFIQSVENGLNLAEITFPTFSVNLSSLSLQLAEIQTIFDLALFQNGRYTTKWHITYTCTSWHVAAICTIERGF